MKVKKEVFESLRLDLQEFTPQEFVAGCYQVTILCSADSYVSTSHGNGNTGVAHSHNISYSPEVLKFANRNIPPSHEDIKGKLSNVTDPGYTSSKKNFNNNYTTGFLFGNAMHFSEWSIVDANITEISDPQHPNVSG